MRKQTQDEVIVTRVSATLRKRAQAAADRRGQGLSEWVRALIAEAISGPILPRKRERRK